VRTLTPDRVALAAYLGHRPAKELLGSASPKAFSLQSMRHGGDRAWRNAMRALGHESAAVAACAVAELALNAYLNAPDAPLEVEALAREAVAALHGWRKERQSERRLADVAEKGRNSCLAVDVGGRLGDASGPRARWLGRVVGWCYGVVLAAQNRRHVRWLGEAAEGTCRLLNVPEAAMCNAMAAALLPYALAGEQRPAADRTCE
jgi:hypothetical protein